MVLRSIDLMLTRRCNLRCAFCYIETPGDGEKPADEVERNLRTLDWIVEQYRAGTANMPPGRRSIQLNLYGGEPTVAWDSVLALNDYKKTCDIPIGMSLVTNMVLMDQARVDFCIANGIGIHCSIDGCQEAEDYFRRTANGTPVSEIVFKNARYLMKQRTSRHCRSTINPETAPWMLKSIRFLCEDIGFPTVSQVLAGGVDWTDEKLEIVKEQTVKITDWWVDCMRAGKHYGLYYMSNMLRGIWNPIRRRDLCGAGLGRAAIDIDGNIYPCHRFCNASTPASYKMGNIYEGGVVNMELEAKLKSFDMAAHHKEKCSHCIAVNSCHALCLHEMLLQGKGMFEPLEHYCKLWPFYYHEAMRAHALLVAEKNQRYMQSYQPRRPGPHGAQRPGQHGGQRPQPARGNGQRPRRVVRPDRSLVVDSYVAAQWEPDPGSSDCPAS